MMGDFTHIPDVYVFDVDNSAEPYWQTGDLSELHDDDICVDEGKQVVVGVCAMAKKSQSKPMKEILTRMEEFEYIKMIVFPEEVILQKPVEEWPMCDCLISFHSKGISIGKGYFSMPCFGTHLLSIIWTCNMIYRSLTQIRNRHLKLKPSLLTPKDDIFLSTDNRQ
ncbi:inositol hexakisphosphate and diphosphoinositol-pentakisphosphate kinase 2 [Macrosteles quadrilineatus]|uniref:inositol hexakisphosphate and diphosphoinositol-pentakisphosphate kinase 2 n=1 Tax=Macrosteles quadrilineatus TaxID=74068 RepID=UPI0023E0FCDA|nr:inositol hexakisphosphate and diphosphoinositol-pentakisphosphate kinase 2 [Macrosteles quadrilineatus]